MKKIGDEELKELVNKMTKLIVYEPMMNELLDEKNSLSGIVMRIGSFITNPKEHLKRQDNNFRICNKIIEETSIANFATILLVCEIKNEIFENEEIYRVYFSGMLKSYLLDLIIFNRMERMEGNYKNVEEYKKALEPKKQEMLKDINNKIYIRLMEYGKIQAKIIKNKNSQLINEYNDLILNNIKEMIGQDDYLKIKKINFFEWQMKIFANAVDIFDSYKN